MIVHWYEGRDDVGTTVRLPDIGGCTPMINSTSEICFDADETPTESSEDCSTPDIEIFRATAFDDLLASDATIKTFAPQIGECSGLPGATMEVTTSENAGEIETINPTRWTSEQGAVVVVADEYHPWILE